MSFTHSKGMIGECGRLYANLEGGQVREYVGYLHDSLLDGDLMED